MGVLKVNEIREIITRANPYYRENPDRLQLFLDDGTIACAGGDNLSFEYRYRLEITAMDYAHHADLIVLPLLVYLRTNQIELFENPDKNKQVIKFKCDYLKENLVDLKLTVDLTERVIVKTDDSGKLVASHISEPEHPMLPNYPRDIEIINRKTGELIGAFHVPSWLEKI